MEPRQAAEQFGTLADRQTVTVSGMVLWGQDTLRRRNRYEMAWSPIKRWMAFRHSFLPL
jgi:hypothetical protein